jgi:hypothetical protein
MRNDVLMQKLMVEYKTYTSMTVRVLSPHAWVTVPRTNGDVIGIFIYGRIISAAAEH